MRNLLNLGTKGLIIGVGAVLGASAVVAWTGPTGTAPNSNVSAPLNVSGTAQTKTGQLWANGNVYMNNGAPTLYMVDSDHRSAMLHTNSNTFYILRGTGTGSTGWTTYNGYWPLTINLENNAATFGGAIDAQDTVSAPRFYTDSGTHFPFSNGYNYLRGHTYFNGVLYDENNPAYYVNPDGQSWVNAMAFSGLARLDGGFVVSSNATASFGGGVHMGGLATGGSDRYVCISSQNLYLTRGSGCASSDIRLKKHIEPLKAGLAEILKLNPVAFEWKDKVMGEGTKLGLIAQEVKEVFPEVITGTGTGVDHDWYGINYDMLAVPMIKAIQELKAENDELRAEIKELRALIESK